MKRDYRLQRRRARRAEVAAQPQVQYHGRSPPARSTSSRVALNFEVAAPTGS